MSGHVKVEIKKAGDGINYPQKGKTVTIHYSGAYVYVCFCFL